MQFVLALALSALAQKPAPVENVSTFPPRSPFEERKALHVPEGFEVQLVAAEPAIQKPMNIAFDDRGRLWVTGSVEYPYAAKDAAPAHDAVKILEDFQPDGRAAKISTFAEGLNIPIGLLPLTGGKGAIVYSIPSIDRFLDTNGDGRADQRDRFYKSYGHFDTHGMTGSFVWGFDGWLYACHGYGNDSTIEGADGVPIQMNSGNIYRMKLDGSRAEYFTHGQVNPFGLAFDPLGNLYSSDCHTMPLYLLLRGAYYPSFGKPDDGLGFGPAMMKHSHNSTAIDGAIYYAADHFPAPYRDTLFVGNVVTNRINHDRLEWRGSSPWALEQPDFLWSEDNWFRPVDMELGPDGALYVADFYNRIIGHYEVPLTHSGRDHDHGRIWRIVYRGPDGKGKAQAPRADWSTATIDALIDDLGHPNLAVRTRAANQVVERNAPGLDARLMDLIGSSQEDRWRRVHALWSLQRRGALNGSVLEQAMTDPCRELRVHAMRVVGERPSLDERHAGKLREALQDPDFLVRRCAAEAMGRHPERDGIRSLLDLLQSAPAEDTHLIHVVRMALRDQLRPPTSWDRLARLAPSERDQRDIANIALGVPSPEAADYLLGHLEHQAPSSADATLFVHHAARYGEPKRVGGPLLAWLRGRTGEAPPVHAALLKAIIMGEQEQGAEIDAETRRLALEVTRIWLASRRESEVLLGLDLAKTVKLSELREALEGIVGKAKANENVRTEALTALLTMDPSIARKVFEDASAPVRLRERALVSLAGIDQDETREALLRALPAVPERLQTGIANSVVVRRAGAEALMRAIEQGKASARLLQQSHVALALHNSELPDIAARISTLLKGLPPADQKLGNLLKQRRLAFKATRRDPAAGAQVFEKNCTACHQIGGKGARIGPQLDGVGIRGLDRLLEDIIDPNRNVDQAFRVTNLALNDGQLVTGLIMREEGAVLVLADAQGKEVRVPQKMVEERNTAPFSPMPANLVEQISEHDLHDLLAYLLLQREKSAPAAKE